MRKSRNTKVKDYESAGSGLLLFLLAFLLVNPVNGLAFAEEADTRADEAGDSVAQSNDSIEPYATTASTVNIAFSPTSVNGVVTPIDATGAKAKVDVTATVRVQNSGGYSVYVGSLSSQLKAGSNVIDSVASSTTYENMPLNRWGYSFAKGSTASNTYNAMPATLRGSALDSNTSTNIKDETRTYTLSFAANIGADKPAGTYTNQVTMSVVSSPLEISNKFGIETMQEMTSTICSSVANGTSDQLKDTRDGKYYWVSKLADGKCWMTQNLDLDLSTSVALTPEDSDVASSWTPEFTTATQATSSTVDGGYSNPEHTRSWNLGNYRITNPTISSDCGYPKNDLSQCASQFMAHDTPTSANGDTNAHYIVGNYYQWNAATAETGDSTTSGQAAPNSICPKGWRLPTGSPSGEFKELLDAYSIAKGSVASMTKLVSSPLYFVRGGGISQNTAYLLRYAGNEGDYWSSTSTSGSNAYSLYFTATTDINSSNGFNRTTGFPIRCVAR